MTSGGTGSVPGAIDFVHLATFRNDGSVVIWTDESLVDGGSGSFISDYQVGDARPEPGAYCSAHIALPVADLQRDRVVNAWYMGGVDVIDFTQPSRLREVAYYDIAPDGPAGSDTRLAYAYAGPDFPRGLGIPVYATEGTSPNSGRDLVVFRADIGDVGMRSSSAI